MSLFFDAEWFDARLAERSLDRAALAAAARIDRAELHRLYSNERPATGEELTAFAGLLGVDLVELNLRCGIAARAADPAADADTRIDGIEARLDAIDSWLAEFDGDKKSA
jgi:hypothetical protein